MSKKKYKTFLSYFPTNKCTWKKYIFTSLPVILSAMVFSLNAFVDNFMSTNIEGGNQALSYANTWTEFQIGIISLTTIIGASIFAQYFGKKDYKKTKEIVRIRYLFAIIITLMFCFPSWIIPNDMIYLISGFDDNILNVVINNSSLYLQLITISWILSAIWFVSTMILREANHGLISFISSLFSLIINIVLNSIFIFGCNFGIEYLAISTIISNLLSLLMEQIYTYIRARNVWVEPFYLFNISKTIYKQFFKRSLSFILLSIGSILVTIRFVFWNIGFPTGTIGESYYLLSAANILGISGMFFNIFWTSVESIESNVAIYVGNELGRDNFSEGYKNSKNLQGFHLIIGIIMGLLLFILSFGIEQMTFLADGYKKGLVDYLINNNYSNISFICNNAISLFMENLKYTLWAQAIFIPMFMWFISRSRIICAGGFTNIVAIVEVVVGGFQIGWICIICLLINKNHQVLSFPLAYFIFFLSDILKLIVYEILYKKINWLRNITKQEKNELINKQSFEI